MLGRARSRIQSGGRGGRAGMALPLLPSLVVPGFMLCFSDAPPECQVRGAPTQRQPPALPAPASAHGVHLVAVTPAITG